MLIVGLMKKQIKLIIIIILEDYNLKEDNKIIVSYINFFLNFYCKLFPPLLYEKKFN